MTGTPGKHARDVRDVAALAASVQSRLTNEVRTTGGPFQEVFTPFRLERFLYRLSRSPHGDRFVLKGRRLSRLPCRSTVWDRTFSVQGVS
jgi:hypothetical protein